MRNITLLACGGRSWTVRKVPAPQPCLQSNFERAITHGVLDRIHARFRIELLIDGAAFGADTASHQWALETGGISTRRFPANWRAYGKSAGFRRNEQMLVEGLPDVVLAFPGGNGTANMVWLAKNAKVPVWTVDAVGLMTPALDVVSLE